MEALTFFAGTLSLLATPGPTNTLLAASGAEVGLRRSLRLLAAELGGYLLAIALLRWLLGPVMTAHPAFGVTLQIVIATYVSYLAVVLWNRGAHGAVGDHGCVTSSRVFVTTFLNPKAIIFSFTLLPSATGLAGLLPWVAALSAQIAMAGMGWIMLGSLLHRGFRHPAAARLGYRLGSIVLLVLASMVASRPIGSV